MNLNINISEYTLLLNNIKQRVLLAQKRAIFSANAEMLRMYWDIGEMLFHKQQEAAWGTKFLERIAIDLKNDFPEIKGFSVRNCQFMIQFYREYNQELTFTKPSVSQLENINTKPPCFVFRSISQTTKCACFLRKSPTNTLFSMEQKQYDDPVKSPVIQEIIMSNRIGAISMELSKRLNIEPVKALQLFYESQTCADLHDKSTGLYLYGDLYVADEFMREMEYGM